MAVVGGVVSSLDPSTIKTTSYQLTLTPRPSD